MKKMIAAVLAAASCASLAQAQAQSQQTGEQNAKPPTVTQTSEQPLRLFTLDDAVLAAGGAAPSNVAAAAGIEAAQAGRAVAGLRPNPTFQGQIENVAGSGPYTGLRSAETTVGVAIPLELGGKRTARIAVATAQVSRAELQAAIGKCPVHKLMTQVTTEITTVVERA